MVDDGQPLRTASSGASRSCCFLMCACPTRFARHHHSCRTNITRPYYPTLNNVLPVALGEMHSSEILLRKSHDI